MRDIDEEMKRSWVCVHMPLSTSVMPAELLQVQEHMCKCVSVQLLKGRTGTVLLFPITQQILNVNLIYMYMCIISVT